MGVAEAGARKRASLCDRPAHRFTSILVKTDRLVGLAVFVMRMLLCPQNSLRRLLLPPRAAATGPKLRSLARRAPGPRRWFTGWRLLFKPLPSTERNFREYADLVHLRLVGFHLYTVAHPDGIKHVLQENHRNYRKSVDYKILARLLGQGLVTR
jgi:hypothetical protein